MEGLVVQDKVFKEYSFQVYTSKEVLKENLSRNKTISLKVSREVNSNAQTNTEVPKETLVKIKLKYTINTPV